MKRFVDTEYKRRLRERILREAESARIKALYRPTLQEQRDELAVAHRLEQEAKSTFFGNL